MRLFCYLRSVLILSFAGIAGLHAQDMRHVEEPHIPAACVVLHARLAAVHGIQPAMDHCTAGKAVVLQPDGAKQTFLSGPLTLRSGVTLVVDADASLAASRDPRLYDITPGSCGVLGEHGQGCKPLLAGKGISDSGVMG